MTTVSEAQLLSSKLYWEAYALESLVLCGFNGKFSKFEEPDLQDKTNSIGIEVVQVLSKDEGEFRAIWNKNAGRGLTSNQFEQKLTKPQLKALVIRDVPAMAAIIGFYDASELIDSTITTIKHKAQKFSHYTKFNRNGLYIFHPHLFVSQIESLKKEIETNKFPFDFYIVNLQDRIIIIDIKNNTTTDYSLTHPEMAKLKANALQFAKDNIEHPKKLLYNAHHS